MNIFSPGEEAVTETQVVTDTERAQEEERQTILHCRLPVPYPCMIRIHPTTYLIEQDGTKRALISSLDIAVAPAWCTGNFSGGYLLFTLVFEGLGKQCRNFYMEEFAGPTENQLFKTSLVPRNQTDVYRVDIIST